MRAALYIRVSTDDQAEDGYSIDDQKRRLTSFVDSQDWEIVDVYIDDGYSAKDLNRPEIKRLIEDVPKNKFDIVLIYKLNRLIRSASDCDYLLKLFEQYSIKFQSCVESYETRTAAGRLFIRLMADIAQFERENIAENVRNGMEQMVMEGKRPGGPIPFGYEDDGITINQEEYLVCRELRRLYMEEKLGFKSIAVQLNNRGMLRRGEYWSSFTVWYVLDNPYYAGKIRWGSKKANGKYASRKKEERVHCIIQDGPQEKIFTWEEYEEHKARMKQRSFNGYTKKREYWFTGVLRCSKCGAAMSGRYHQNKRKDGSYHNILSYICANRQSGQGCTMPMFRQELVEKLILEYIETIRVDHALLDSSTDKKRKERKNTKSEIDSLRKELSKVQARKKEWQRMFIDLKTNSDNVMLTEGELRDHIKEERDKEEYLLSRIESLELQERSENNPTNLKQLFELSEVWPILEDEDRSELIKTIFQTIVLDTPLERAHGKKGVFIPASIKHIEYA